MSSFSFHRHTILLFLPGVNPKHNLIIQFPRVRGTASIDPFFFSVFSVNLPFRSSDRNSNSQPGFWSNAKLSGSGCSSSIYLRSLSLQSSLTSGSRAASRSSSPPMKWPLKLASPLLMNLFPPIRNGGMAKNF